MSASAPISNAAVTPRHYQALCGLALATIFMIQWHQSTLTPQITLLVNLLMLLIGGLGVFQRARFSPVFVLIAIAAPIATEQYYLKRDFPEAPNVRFLDLADLLLCMAALAYFIGHYRLQGLSVGVLPTDARMQPGPEGKAAPPRVRSEESLSAMELASLIFTVPAFVLLAEIAGFLVRLQWTMVDLPPRWKQFLAVAWILLFVMFMAAHLFRYWRRLQLDRVGVLILLQDILWNETRGEQRRINRWIAWKKVRERKQSGADPRP